MDFFTPDIIFSFITLSMLEIVLGIDNLIFIALVCEALPEHKRRTARMVGLSLALFMRVGMLLGVAWIMHLTEPLFALFEIEFSFKDILLLAGGGFLIAKATFEMHSDLAGEEEKREIVQRNSFFGVVVQIVLIDLVFSFDSILTAVGLTPHIPVIIAAIMVSMAIMVAASEWLSSFLQRFPTFKMLALSFILMIGMLLVAEGLEFHVPRGYVYFAFAFSIFVEGLNTLASRRRKRLREARKKASG